MYTTTLQYSKKWLLKTYKRKRLFPKLYKNFSKYQESCFYKMHQEWLVGIVGYFSTTTPSSNMILYLLLYKLSDMVKFVMCNLVSRVHMTFYIITERWTVRGNQGTHYKLHQFPQYIYSCRYTVHVIHVICMMYDHILIEHRIKL